MHGVPRWLGGKSCETVSGNFDASLLCFKTGRASNAAETTTFHLSLPGDDDQFSSVSAESLSYNSTEPPGTSVHKDFLLGMKMAACHAGFLLPPLLITRMISHLPEGFYNLSHQPHMSNSCHLPCLTFGSALRYHSYSISK